VSHGVVWFRNDLRLDDNPAWAAATSAYDCVTALFVMDPALWEGAPEGRRSRLEDHLAALDIALAARGGRLRVERGDPDSVVPKVADADPVHWNSDVTPYATRRDEAVAALVEAEIHHGRWIIPVGTVTTNQGEPYRVFTPFFKKWREIEREPWPESGDARLQDYPGRGLGGGDPADAGERAARVRLDRFLEVVDEYQDRRDFPGIEGTSRLSEDLKFGTISPRLVEEIVGTATAGRAGFVRQLAWREFCAQLLWANPHIVDHELREEYAGMAWHDDPEAIEAWKAGRTGYPIIDAGMRQLATEGWMHNRVRMLTASFLVKDLLVDWRVGERHFASLLHDYDVAQNVANWQWVAGTGADAAPYFRVFNPVTQGRRFDPDGDYVRRWVPELDGIEGVDIHAPWELGPLELAAAGITLGDTYPGPIVDHAEARDEAIAMYEAAKGHVSPPGGG
jgi:deoxyribodipyrimidine photo-lyase